jgi:predicted  nucleic acid-binding Zn-ribbon protein
MKERLLLLYELNKIDKELNELYSLRGDLPGMIEEDTEKKTEIEQEIESLKDEITELEENEKLILEENDTLTKKIDKNDGLLRAGAVKTNQEYNALAKEIGDAYEKIDKNEKIQNDEYKPKKIALNEKLTGLSAELEEVLAKIQENTEKLKDLNKQTEEEEIELKQQKEELLPKIDADDLEYYERINRVKFGDAFAIVRKGSCLGCYNSIPPQRVIEIRMADSFFHCEACGRILISEEYLEEKA